MQLIECAIKHTQLRYEEALHIFTLMEGVTHDRVKTIASLLPHVIDNRDSRNLVYRVLGESPVELLRLKQIVGSCYGPMMGCENGMKM